MHSDRVAAWQEQGEFERFRERRVFVRCNDGAGPALVFLHGFPTSSFDFNQLVKRFSGRDWMTFDFLGFGLSDKPRDHDYSLAWQADLATELIGRHLADRPVTIVAHDMGTSVATELMARDLAGELPFDLAGVVLFNGSVLLHLATPILGQRVLRGPLGAVLAPLNNGPVFRAQLASVFSDGHKPSREELQDHWELVANNGGRTMGRKLISYMDQRERYAERWHGAVRDWQGGLAFVWGLSDPVANPDVFNGLRELSPRAAAFPLPALGHYPHLEDPAVFGAELESALASLY
ncbi:MAG: alpha/beta hydrolase [Thermoleophilaceae bacterium]|nr:alpha/beta hydrolase [Thermoleophilaceae bacterium]